MKAIYSYFTNNKNLSLLAFDAVEVFEHDEINSLKRLDEFLTKHQNDYRFGFLSYNLNLEQETEQGEKINRIGFPKIGFFVPRYVVEFDENRETTFLKGEDDAQAKKFIKKFFTEEKKHPNNTIHLNPGLSKEEYISRIGMLQKEMAIGPVEAVVFCQDFYADNCELQSLQTYFELNRKTKAPFSCFVEWEGRQLLSGSPERFLKKEGQRLVTEPIKGTAKRGETSEEDEFLKNQLLASEKEREENSMIANLVKKELTKIARESEVNIDELYGVYTFETVHQLISTLSATVDEELSFSDIIDVLFPMGSMTGSPKEESLQLLDRFENFSRGLYSGSVGYFKPNGDFDFNVVIRSILYNENTKKISCPVGGGITLKSDPESEFEECLVKVKALKEVLNTNG